MVERIQNIRDQIAKEVSEGTRDGGHLLGADLLLHTANVLHSEGLFPQELSGTSSELPRLSQPIRETPETEDKMIKISEAAKMLGVVPETIRNWTKSGILNAQRSEGNHRRYSFNEIRGLIEASQTSKKR